MSEMTINDPCHESDNSHEQYFLLDSVTPHETMSFVMGCSVESDMMIIVSLVLNVFNG